MADSSRMAYYSSMKNYQLLEQIRTMLVHGKPAASVIEILDRALSKRRINVNDMMRNPLQSDCWVSILYAASISEHHIDIFKYLLQKGANPRLEADVDECHLIPIIFACHHSHLKTLINLNCRRDYPRQVMDRNILNKIREGSGEHLETLHELGIINMKNYQARSQLDLIGVCLQNMKDYLMYCYNCRKNDDGYDKTEVTNQTIAKFRLLVIKLMTWGCTMTADAAKLCHKFYLYEILSLVPSDTLTAFRLGAPVRHEDMDPLVVATFRPLLNDFRYSNMRKLDFT